MKNNNSASLEARIKNSKELISFIKEYDQYVPTSDELKQTNYETFVTGADSSVTPLKDASAQVLRARSNENDVFSKIIKISKDVRSEIFELKGKEADEWKQVNNIVKLITGENIKEHSDMKRKILKDLKEGDPQPVFVSVSELDHKSMLGNFRSLTALVRTFVFYNPSDTTITATSLDTLEANAASSLAETADKETNYLTERSRIIQLLDGKGGLKDRARRAKAHVKRKYGIKSPEYKALTKKMY